MKKWIFAVIMLLTSWANAEVPCRSASQIQTGSTILLIGDSLGVGLGHEFKELARAGGYKPVVHAVNGTTTWQWTTKLIQKDLETYRPALVIVSLGTNDAVLNINWIRNHSDVYQRLIAVIENSGAKLVWIGPPKLPTRLHHATEVRTMIRDTGVPYFESEDVQLQQPDQIHSTPSGYKFWMQQVWTWMSILNIVTQK